MGRKGGKMPVFDFGVKTKKKILIAEDDLFLGDILELALSKNYEVLRANDGKSAVEKTKWSKPDLIVLDMMMPEMGGYEVLRILQNDSETDKIPILILTSRNFDRTTIAMFKQESNVINYLQKPITPDLLLYKIDEILR